MSDEALRDRIAAVIDREVDRLRLGFPSGRWEPLDVADAVIAELNIASPCATRGCLLRLTALRHAQSSSALEANDE